MLERIRIVLCNTSHPGNIGAAARAMKNMGLRRLFLVAPECFPSAVATERASGADDVLSQAQVVSSLKEAIADCHWVYGSSARTREFSLPILTPHTAGMKIINQAQSYQEVAILFGTERSGLTNQELQACDYHISIPTHPDYYSLNLAQAVQVIAYEIFQQSISGSSKEELRFDKATHQEVEGLIQHFEQTAIALKFMDPKNPQKLIPRVQRLFAKAQLEKEEVNILRGLFKAILGK